MRLIRWFRSAWADAAKSGEWMADAPSDQPLPRWGRWAIRTQPRTSMLLGLTLLAIPVLVLATFLILLVILLIDVVT